MDANTETLIPAAELARTNPVRMPNESAEYRAARDLLLVEEIELRRQVERVAALRRALPPGGAVTGDYRFVGEDGAETDFDKLFGDKPTLAIYGYMFGPERKRPCPMCTNVLDSWDANAIDIGQHMALAVVARSPIERLVAWKQERGWKHLRLYSDLTGAYSRDQYGVFDDGSESGTFAVFTRRDGTIRHFWSGEITNSDPGQDPRGNLVTYTPLWNMLDSTPEGRPADWYPSLTYA
jgi:predicted dithiol-disulfide oxidoreductase (DUF899 family)